MIKPISFAFGLLGLSLLVVAGCSSGGSSRNLSAEEKYAVQHGPLKFSSLPKDQQEAIKKRLAAAMSGGPRQPQIPGTRASSQ